MAAANLDVEYLHQALQRSFSPDESQRKPAEELIKELKYTPETTVMLLRVASESQVQFEVRQAAAIQLKNIVKECWAERSMPLYYLSQETAAPARKVPLLGEEPKLALRTSLLDALLSEPEKRLRDLYAETFNHIILHDFPEKWQNLLPFLLNAIGSPKEFDGSALRVHNALLGLRKMTKRYEYKAREQRGPLNDIVAHSFPTLLAWAERLIEDPNETSEEAALMLKQILKIFWSSTQFYLPAFHPTANPLPPWFDLFFRALMKPLPEETQPKEKEARNNWPWWKVKKWIMQLLCRFFSRYGMPKYAEDDVKEFAHIFSTETAPRFLQPVCGILQLRSIGHFVTDRVLHLCLQYVDLCVELSHTYKVMKPHLHFLLYQVSFPVICMSEDDINMFENDPHEYIQRQTSIMMDFYDPKLAAIALIQNLVKHRGKDITEPLLQFLNEKLSNYRPENGNHTEKDGALYAIGSLSEYLLTNQKYASQLEAMMVSSVIPELNSNISYLRCRACWMLQRFSKINWSPSSLNMVIEGVLKRLSDPALPVQIEASKALRFLIEIEGAETTLLPVLPQILNEYFRIMNEIGNDEVVAALQVIIDRFGDGIEPHALALVQQLLGAFETYCATGDEDDDAAMAAAQCLECISTVLKGVSERPDIYAQMEPSLLPVICKILGNEGDFIEYIEYALDILTYLTYFPAQISPPLWDTIPLIYRAFEEWAFDYMSMMAIPLENFISKAADLFLKAKTPEGIKYIDLIITMVQKTVNQEHANESESRKALGLFMCILHNCAGRVDEYLPVMNEVVLTKLKEQLPSDRPQTRVCLFQIIASSFHYNPMLQLQDLERRGATSDVFSQWMVDISNMKNPLPKKLTVLGLMSILRLPTSSLPPSVSSSLSQLISAAVTISHKMLEEASSTPDENGNGGDHPDFDAYEGVGEDEDVANFDDDIYENALNALGSDKDLSTFLLGDGWDDYDEDDDYTSPIDNINEFVFLSDTLNGAFQREPGVYQQVQAQLSSDITEMCSKIFGYAEQIRGAAQAS